jgi:putative transposase
VQRPIGNDALRPRGRLRRLERIFDRYRHPIFVLRACVARRAPVLACPTIHDILRDVWRDTEQVHGWMIGQYMVMPDHVHLFATALPDSSKDLSGFGGGWKNRTQNLIREAILPNFHWQEGFFDYLIRSQQSYAEQLEYVRQNPVRAGLVANPDDWPYQGEVNALEWRNDAC